MASMAQTIANRQNAALSTGPTTPAGKEVAFDCILQETKQILQDYVTLLNAPANATVAQHLAAEGVSRSTR